MSLRHALLGLLAAGPASGYELTKQFELSLANVWSAKHSQIYPELQRLADNGWVQVGEEGARGRKEYRITTSGRDELRRWLTTERPDRSGRNEAMLRVFFLWTLPDDEAADYLEGEAADYRAVFERLDRLDAAVPWGPSPSQRMSRLALEQGRRWATTMAEWATWAAEQVRAGRSAPELLMSKRGSANRRDPGAVRRPS
jgi:DNA-binding PadR family transcriptional regulator